jgi:hypothetical protein
MTTHLGTISSNNSILIRGSFVSPMATSKNTIGRVWPAGGSGMLDMMVVGVISKATLTIQYNANPSYEDDRSKFKGR